MGWKKMQNYVLKLEVSEDIMSACMQQAFWCVIKIKSRFSLKTLRNSILVLLKDDLDLVVNVNSFKFIS